MKGKMASLLRFARQTCRVLQVNPALRQRFTQPSSFISTSGKHKDSATITEKVENNAKVEDNLLDKEENWISFGYSLVDREEDEWGHHMIMFFTVTIALCGGGFYLAYAPDYRDRAWAQREAYLELAHREAQGLPHIDRNLVNPDNIDLPSDEELGTTDIVI